MACGGPRHDKFLKALQEKQLALRVAAVAEGTLHAGELPAGEHISLQAKAKEYAKKQIEYQRIRERKDAGFAARLKGVPGPRLFASLCGCTVSVALVADRTPGFACLAAQRMAETAIVDAIVVIADHIPGRNDLTNADKKEIKAQIVAGYFGKFLTTPQFLLSTGNSSACVKFTAFCKKKRALYFTVACRAAFWVSDQIAGEVVYPAQAQGLHPHR